MTATIEPLLQPPRLPGLLDELQRVWAAERARRERFYEEITEDTKAEFIVEVLSPSTEHLDRGVKFEDDASNGVAEYGLVNPQLEQIEQCVLQDGRFASVGVFGDGTITSRIVQGFSIPVRAVLDAQVNLRTLAQMMR